MINFSIALLVYLGVGLMVATYETVTSPPYDEEDKELWDSHDVSKFMAFPKNPKLFFFCIISLAWPLHLSKKFK